MRKIFTLFTALFCLFYSLLVFACDEIFNYSDMAVNDPLYSLFMSNCPANTYTISFFGTIRSFCNTAESLEDFNNNAGTPVNVLITSCTTACSSTLDDEIIHSYFMRVGNNDWKETPPIITKDGCGYSYNKFSSSPVLGCRFMVDNSVFCNHAYKGTGQSYSSGTPQDPDSSPIDDGVLGTNPQITLTNENAPPLLEPDTPANGQTTLTNQTTETKIKSGSNKLTNTDVVTLTTNSGQTVIKTTTTSTITNPDGSTSEIVTTTYTDTGETRLINVYDPDTGTLTAETTIIKKPKNGSSTKTTNTNSDGSGGTEIEGEGDCALKPENCGEEDEEDEEEKYPPVEDKGGEQYKDYLDGTGIDGLISDLGSDDPGLFSFSSPISNMSSGCQSITTNFGNKVFTFPGNDGCQRLEQLKDIFAFVLYVLTAYSIFEIAIRRPV